MDHPHPCFDGVRRLGRVRQQSRAHGDEVGGWVLVTLYTGLVGAVLYVMSCKEPRPGTHERFISPLWKQGVGSTIHCVAGDATGIVFAATVTALLGFPMWIDLIVEYALGFGFGLFTFQALFIKDMMGGSYRRALKMSLLPEWLSLHCHINHHTTNDNHENEGAGGLTLIIEAS
jgi:hypothetical protein